jgi:hypothetical protein
MSSKTEIPDTEDEVYYAKVTLLCDKIQDQIKEGDTLDMVMEAACFIVAGAGLQMIEIDTAIPDKQTFLQHLVTAVAGQMEDLEKQDKDKLTGGNYVQ